MSADVEDVIWPRSTIDYARSHGIEVALAMTGVELCDRCRDEHFRPYPERPDRDCLIVNCQCWCTTRRDQ